MSAPDPTPRPGPDALTMLSFALLGVLALLLLWPLLTGGAAPSPALVGGLLLLRLGLQVLRARRDERLRRPASWALDLLLIALIFGQLSRQPGG
ncbi:hypothetical protein [Deinococcus multiflagellatus]|uniref:DUF3017 domain-containing protein n=1 Tax=Deinococcus multiflagellatus TaxID=1656887 RepID=A0ABW1ZN32_9DEIO|nr:hypothetical protein [Deinococcus multiflagellatus]MBZ9712662.1 hypothetical protein [Deinococcus multiflagellatus]